MFFIIKNNDAIALTTDISIAKLNDVLLASNNKEDIISELSNFMDKSEAISFINNVIYSKDGMFFMNIPSEIHKKDVFLDSYCRF